MQRTSFKPKPCKCGGMHSSMQCPLKQRKSLAAKKPMNKIGKVQRETASFVEKWKRKQKPNHQGYYQCYISGEWVTYLMAEHPYSKTRHPELRTDQILEPVSAEINKLKGSMDITDFLEKYPQYKKTVKKKYLGYC